MLYRLYRKQRLQTDLQTAWDFMSAPANLTRITPAYMGFHILTEKEQLQQMHAGQLIEYYVTPLAGIKLHWVTEITHVKDKSYFVDEQRFGSYGFWHHQHFLKEVAAGVEMVDLLHYKLPFGFMGRLMHHLLVKKKINGIFDYRYQKLEEIFNAAKPLS